MLEPSRGGFPNVFQDAVSGCPNFSLGYDSPPAASTHGRANPCVPHVDHLLSQECVPLLQTHPTVPVCKRNTTDMVQMSTTFRRKLSLTAQRIDFVRSNGSEYHYLNKVYLNFFSYDLAIGRLFFF